MSIISILRKQKINVVFSHEYIGIPASENYQEFDILKYKKIRDNLVEQKLLNRKKILKPQMVSYEEMALVHSQKYLSQIKDPTNVGRILNLGYINPWDSYILEYFRIVTGGTIHATLYALENRGVVFNLGGGFHHARVDKGAGFCLINDVAIAIQKAKQTGGAKNILIIDLDYHQGDGNLLFFKDDQNVYTFSVHVSHWEKITKNNNADIVVSSDCDGMEYLAIIKNEIDDLLKKFKPDLVFYIAGSDPYEKDTLGDMRLTREELLERNLFVLNKIKSLELPMVIVAGGGYGPDSWVIYYDFLKAALS